VSHLRLATRRSPLALAQATEVARRLEQLGATCEIVEVVTTGDRQDDVPLTTIAGQGVFTAEVQHAVLEGRADVAVHSAKDLPSVTPEGLSIACVPERRDPADVLVGRSLAGLGPGATVATGSPRRRSLLAERRPDLNFVELRGNMASRLAAVNDSGIDAVVAAAAALDRLGWNEQIAERLDPEWFVPQVGQGAIALEVRADDAATQRALAAIHDEDAAMRLICERAFLAELGAGCAIPAAAHATLHNGVLSLSGMMAAPSGMRVLRFRESGPDARALGVLVARYIRDELGGGELPASR